MSIPVEDYGHAVILKPKGELVEDTVGAFREVVEHQMEDDAVVDVIVDMEDITFIDSVVLEYLLDLQDSLQEKFGQVRLSGCNNNIAKILEMTRLDAVFEMFENTEDAVRVAGA
ncbi:MAG: STAS domain-containing protein [Phycisphaerae bacterium]|jgi:anti-anti-sigma factor|nr:STAS domain-containing protein [Phycisphaerae bacterium]|tara:strand:- start:205 stop:546 length:342 start_codon:yes stop_codon:yes gene_type:complete